MTEFEIKNAKPADKNYFLTDIKGLRILIHKSGFKYWQFRYSYQKQRKIITIGSYPQISLLQARKKALEFQELIANNKDPQFIKRKEQISSEIDIEAQVHKIYEKWFVMQSKKHKEGTLKRTKRFFEMYFFPYFSKYDKDRNIFSSSNINDITHYDIINIVTKHEKTNGSDLARRLLFNIKSLWRYAFNVGLLRINPLSDIVVSEVLSPVSKNHYPKITDEKILGELLRSIDFYPNSVIIKTALQFVALVPLRSGNLCKLKWSYIDWNNKALIIPRSEMKVNDQSLSDFKLPLSDQAIDVLREIQIFTGFGEWVFHSVTDFKKPMVSDSLVKALRNMGFSDEARGRKQVVHSFRGTFRSLCDTYQNEHNSSFEIKEAILDHRIGNKVTRAYNHKADYTEQMRLLLQWWADFLDRAKSGRL